MTSEAAALGGASQAADARRRLSAFGRTTRGLKVGAGIVGCYAVVAILAHVIAPYGPITQNISASLQSPSSAHWLGTDALGRDELSRLLYATRYDLFLGVASTGLALGIGALIGVLAGYFRGSLDNVVSRMIDLVLAIPTYALVVVLLFVLGTGALSVIVVLAVTDWVNYARLSRGQVLVTREHDFVAAARLGGIRHLRVMLRHVLPNVSSQLIVLWASDVVMAIGTIAALGYLGIGIQPPTAEWGVMVQDGQNYLLSNWWLSVAPGVAIAVLGIGLALISDGMAGRRPSR
jgi:peptide/nickel transport system permease protein